jgi:hypothetical protein
MIKTPHELKEQVQKMGLTHFPVHKCSMCGYPCGYIFSDDRVSYDSGCYCVGGIKIEERTWEDLADTYNMNQPENNPDYAEKHPESFKQYYAIWKFDDLNSTDTPLSNNKE